MFSDSQPVDIASQVLAEQKPLEASWQGTSATEPSTRPGKRDKLAMQLVSTAIKLQPLFELLERIQPHLENGSVFTSRREKMHAQLAVVRMQLKSEQPKHKAIVEAFHLMGEFVREEAHEVTKDEVKESAKRFVLATLKNAPSLIAAARQAGVLH
jgi:hypothetical protein